MTNKMSTCASSATLPCTGKGEKIANIANGMEYGENRGRQGIITPTVKTERV